MKKKLIILVLLATVAFQSFGISSTDLKYRYTSYGRGYSSATYEGTNRTVDKLKKYRELRNILEGDSSTIVYDCDKLSMLESSLLWEAMKEFDYRTGEIYSFRICTGDFFSREPLIKRLVFSLHRFEAKIGKPDRKNQPS